MSTSIRAIPSTLSLKTQPTIPSAAIVYQPYLKSVLQTRLWYNIFLTGFALCWVECTLSASNKDRWIMLRHDVLLRSVCTWLVGFVPVVVLRKAFLTTTRLGQSSPAKTLTAHLSHIQTKTSFALFTVSALCLSLIQEDTPRVFVKSRKHPLYLNPSFVFVVLSQIVLGLMFCLREIMLSDRPVLSFRLRHQTGWATLPFTTSILIALFTTITLPVTFAVFFSGRLALPVVYWFPPLRWILKPFTNHFFRTSLFRTVFLPLTHLSLVRKAWSVGWSTALVWEAAQCLFAIHISAPITITTSINDPIAALVAGVTYPTSPKKDEEGKARIYALHAYEELLHLFTSTEDAARTQRIKLFEDQRYTPFLIHHLIRESLLWLGKDYSFFLHRGSPPPPPPASSSSSEPKKLPMVPPNTPIGKVKENTILSKEIFSTPIRSPLRNVLDGLSSEGDIVRVAEDVVGPIPELFRSSTSSLWSGITSPQRNTVATAVTPTTPSSSSSSSGPNTTEPIIKAWLPSNPIPPNQVILDRVGLTPLQEWWTRERKDKQVAIWIKGDAGMAIGIIRLLSAIICTSLSEDTYGAVQSKIPQILEAFVRFLDEIDVVSAQLSSQLPSTLTSGTGTGTTEEEEVRKALDALVPLREALKEGLADVVRTFRDKLGAFVFPVRVVRRLDEFLGWVGS